MKLNGLIFLFFVSSCALVFFALQDKFKPLNDERLELIRLSKIQKVCMKSYPRKRKIHLSLRSFTLAQEDIDNILKKRPLAFRSNSTLLDENGTDTMKRALNDILLIVNHVREDVILSIETHTDDTGSKQHNLLLSQKRADVLKNYFIERTEIPLIVAIGYGETLPISKDAVKKDNRRVEINLKRIKQ